MQLSKKISGKPTRTINQLTSKYRDSQLHLPASFKGIKTPVLWGGHRIKALKPTVDFQIIKNDTIQ